MGRRAFDLIKRQIREGLKRRKGWGKERWREEEGRKGERGRKRRREGGGVSLFPSVPVKILVFLAPFPHMRPYLFSDFSLLLALLPTSCYLVLAHSWCPVRGPEQSGSCLCHGSLVPSVQSS